ARWPDAKLAFLPKDRRRLLLPAHLGRADEDLVKLRRAGQRSLDSFTPLPPKHLRSTEVLLHAFSVFVVMGELEAVHWRPSITLLLQGLRRTARPRRHLQRSALGYRDQENARESVSRDACWRRSVPHHY